LEYFENKIKYGNGIFDNSNHKENILKNFNEILKKYQINKFMMQFIAKIIFFINYFI